MKKTSAQRQADVRTRRRGKECKQCGGELAFSERTGQLATMCRACLDADTERKKSGPGSFTRRGQLVDEHW